MSDEEREELLDAFEQEIGAEYRRLFPLGRLTIRKATKDDLRETLQWLWQEQQKTGHSFYCNRQIIQRARAEGTMFVARVGKKCVGLLLDNHGPEIVTTHPEYRRRGIGRALISYNVARARKRGDKEINAQCVTDAGEELCIAAGFHRTGGDRYVLDVT
jgi:GNAT superfamily N-acetyltransferase